MKKMQERVAGDERWDPEKYPPPFDGKRMGLGRIHAGSGHLITG